MQCNAFFLSLLLGATGASIGGMHGWEDSTPDVHAAEDWENLASPAHGASNGSPMDEEDWEGGSGRTSAATNGESLVVSSPKTAMRDRLWFFFISPCCSADTTGVFFFFHLIGA